MTSGFMGGEPADPDDAAALVAAGHAEVVQVEFDPRVVSYGELLEWFWRVHDPTSRNRQGEDEGPEYRSAIFTHGEAQRREVKESRARAQAELPRPIVTQVEPAGGRRLRSRP